MNQQLLYTPQQAADALQVSRSTLARMRISGAGPKFVRLSPHKVGYREADIHVWLDSRVKTSTSE